MDDFFYQNKNKSTTIRQFLNVLEKAIIIFSLNGIDGKHFMRCSICRNFQENQLNTVKLDKEVTVGIEIDSSHGGDELVSALADKTFVSFMRVKHYEACNQL